jgi:hypothetical protein
MKDKVFIQDNPCPHCPAMYDDEALGVCNVIYSDRHVLHLDVWKFAGNGNLRQIAQNWKLVYDNILV